MPLPAPVVFVPGITATYLADEYPIPPDLVWTVMTKDFQRIRLHPDNPRYETNQPARIVPGQIYEIAYKEIMAELRYNLSPREDQPVPVFAFGYDWRMPLDAIQRSLADFVSEVVDRTKLMRHYADDGYGDDARVNLVGHSMGGLVIAGYLADQKGKAPVSKVCTLASPFRGSFEAIVKMLTGTADLGGGAPSSREREAARVTPALYHLLPTVADGLTFDGVPSASLFDPAAWQPSILQTIDEYVRLYAVDPGRKADRAKQAMDLFKGMLGAAESHRKKIESMKLANIGLEASDWLAVVGVGSTTRVRMTVHKGAGAKPEFILTSRDRLNNYDPKSGTPDQHYTGDGTVPFEGAVPGFLDRSNLVCVCPDDYGYWELQDRLTTRVGGFHGILPNMDMLHRLIVRFFTGTPDRRENTWGRPAPGVANSEWDPPLPLNNVIA
ncbi:MAG: hypothetical protein GIKADHBN_02505 [Phycisphaerales bacterium]|nr:hypothetical protein [Phycisphaerales bacterium]MCK6478045.1 alpha/beta fold hydrolase [Phycisphaerales bacterium]